MYDVPIRMQYLPDARGAAASVSTDLWRGGQMTQMGDLGITSSYEEWLEEFIMINSDPGSGSAGSPTTRKDYYAKYCDPGTDLRQIYEHHKEMSRRNRLRGAITDSS